MQSPATSAEGKGSERVPLEWALRQAGASVRDCSLHAPVRAGRGTGGTRRKRRRSPLRPAGSNAYIAPVILCNCEQSMKDIILSVDEETYPQLEWPGFGL